MPKCRFFVWYLGSKEANGVRGPSAVLPAMRQLLNDSFIKAPNKATVQVSGRGLKLTQVLPTMSKSGQVKCQRMKFQIEATNITYSMIASAPFDDVVAVVMLVHNPEMHSPIHVHCYRCDSTQTATLLHNCIQKLIDRTEVQRSIASIEERLFLSGFMLPRVIIPNVDACSRLYRRTTFQELKRKPSNSAQTKRIRQERTTNISDPHGWAFHSEQKYGSMDDLSKKSIQTDSQRRFCDSRLHERKSISVDNLMFALTVGRNHDEEGTSRTFKNDVKGNRGFGCADKRNSNFSALWKRSQRSLSLLNNL
ncbi:unnamed protein product [Toxocara canis]|uniref:PID domain-containing protein n=1 Tax=Toxocara canis TaxID=6265 RepID=A0A183VA18_TOXCA|nr:unnamed protein product [Toxocara canis]